MNLLLASIGLGLALGIIIEILAGSLRLWVYQPRWLVGVNIGLMFGLIYGGMSAGLANAGLFWQFAAGAGLGIAYEAANFAGLHAWSFPQGRLLFLRGRVALTLGVGLTWGAIPPVICVLAPKLVSGVMV